MKATNANPTWPAIRAISDQIAEAVDTHFTEQAHASAPGITGLTPVRCEVRVRPPMSCGPRWPGAESKNFCEVIFLEVPILAGVQLGASPMVLATADIHARDALNPQNGTGRFPMHYRGEVEAVRSKRSDQLAVARGRWDPFHCSHRPRAIPTSAPRGPAMHHARPANRASRDTWACTSSRG